MYRFSIMIMDVFCARRMHRQLRLRDASLILDFFDYPMNGAQQHNSAEIYGRAIVYGILQPLVYGKAHVSSYFGMDSTKTSVKQKNETSSAQELTMRTMDALEYYPSHT